MPTALEPRYRMGGPTHLLRPRTAETYCGVPSEPFIRRDQFEVKEADRCGLCWATQAAEVDQRWAAMYAEGER